MCEIMESSRLWNVWNFEMFEIMNYSRLWNVQYYKIFDIWKLYNVFFRKSQKVFLIRLGFSERRLGFQKPGRKGTLSLKMLAKKIVQVRIKITQRCKLYQSIPCVPENQKNFWALDFRLFKKPSISRRFAIFNLKLLK